MVAKKSVAMFLLNDERLRRLLSEHLIDLGWKVVVVASADEAARRAMATPPTLIVGDEALLPPEVAMSFATLPTLRDVPIAVLVAHLPIALRDAYLKAHVAATVLLGTMSLTELERLLVKLPNV